MLSAWAPASSGRTEISEGVAAQVPSTWRGIIEEAGTLQLFLDFYAASQPPLSSMALECLVRRCQYDLCDDITAI